jgi:hypothetical protein
MRATRAIVIFAVCAAIGFAAAASASPPCEPLALGLTVTRVEIDGNAAAVPSGTFNVRSEGGGAYVGVLFDPDTKSRVVALTAR